ncbi:DUF6049 family protein, partial [Actinotalea sp. C106]|uniref:DUF6049 family protein n=1 Tax=Actinotalea sp. C106 TaxID=2908644 RepID=UPI00202879CC
MRAPAGRSRRAAVLAGLALTTALTLGPLAAVALLTAPPSAAGTPGTASTLPATVEEDGLPISVTVDAVTPQVLTPGEDLRLRVTLDNLGDAAVVEPRVLVHLDPRSFISRSSLDRWRTAGPEDSLGTVVLQVDLEEPLGAGASTSQTVTVPAASLGLRTSPTAWGARGVAVQVVDVDDAARRTQGVARTFALWFPLEEVTATRVSVLVPVVGPAPDQSEEGWTAELDELTGPEGRLTAMLEATGEHRHVTWAVDPWLVDAASGALSGTGAEEPTPGEEEGTADPDQDGSTSTAAPEDPEDPEDPAAEGTESGDGEPADPDDPDAGDEGGGDVPSTTAEAWAATLVEDTTNRDVQLLPYTDLDLAALAHTQDEDLLDMGVARSQIRAVDGPLPDGAALSLAWPLEEAPDLATAALVADRGALVVGPGTLPSPAVLTYTPTGRTTVTTANGDAAVLVPDERLSTALRTGGAAMPLPTADPASTEGGAEAGALDVSPAEGHEGAALSPAEAAQDLLAELAVIT